MKALLRAVLPFAFVAAACGASGAAPAATASTAPSATERASAPPTVPAPSSLSPAPDPPPSRVPPVGALIDLRDLSLDAADLVGTTLSQSVSLTSGTTGTWTSRWYEPGFGFTRLVPSWSADTPGGSFIRVRAQARTAGGDETAWYSFGVWAYDDDKIPRSSSDGQRDRFGRVDTDTYLASSPLAAYRLRFELYRDAAASPSPVLRAAYAVASDPTTIAVAACTTATCPLLGSGKELSVPAYSQEIHAGELPEFDGGGEAWCSPTSTAMVLAYWSAGPTAADTWWVPARYRDAMVDHAARYTYDSAYGGTGNWPFNTAYAAHFGMRAFVTQLRSLGEAERFIAAGVPLVASVKVKPGGLPGFLYAQGTNGHLLVIRGFTASGDVIANDPAATSDDTVRRVYPRAAFETAWLGGSAGTVYVIRPPSAQLPARATATTPNW